jgi:hypothetical protein
MMTMNAVAKKPRTCGLCKKRIPVGTHYRLGKELGVYGRLRGVPLRHYRYHAECWLNECAKRYDLTEGGGR